MPLSAKSLQMLNAVHPDLARIVTLAYTLTEASAKGLTFRVTEGLRTKERQEALVKAGASWTMNSRHLSGHAVDLAAEVNGVVRWDWPLYHELAQHMGEAARQLGVPILWGGNWKVRDGPHFELPRREYP